MIGVDSVFLSHLPMFMRPHNYQVILHVSFGTADSTYRKDRKDNPGSKLYTFAPVPFILPELFAGEGGAAPKRTSFRGTLVRNHFEQPPAHPEEPAEIASGVDARVVDVVHHQRFLPDARPPEQLTYLLFGKGDEKFVAHLVTRPPDFDQLVSVEVTGNSFSDEQLLRGIEVTVQDRPNESTKRMQAGEKEGAVATVEGVRVPVEIDAKVELYFETSDLMASM